MEVGDDVLLAAARAGDVEAFAVLVRRHQARVYRVALRLLGSEADAEEATQDAFVRAWRALGGFRGQSGLSTWLYRIVTNGCLTMIATRRVAAPLSEDVPSPRDGPAEEVQRRERFAAIAREIAILPPEQRAALVLRGLQGGYEGELVLDGRRGRTQVSGRALGTLASLAALSVPGVALASVRRVELDLARAGTVRIDLRLVIELGPSVEALTTRVRGAVGRRLSGGAGASAVTVDIEIADVLA
ncbi:MAG: sigma-70 family RNA polymerase sigma factor [Solirubrobacteraceae bacterium]